MLVHECVRGVDEARLVQAVQELHAIQEGRTSAEAEHPIAVESGQLQGLAIHMARHQAIARHGQGFMLDARHFPTGGHKGARQALVVVVRSHAGISGAGGGDEKSDSGHACPQVPRRSASLKRESPGVSLSFRVTASDCYTLCAFAALPTMSTTADRFATLVLDGPDAAAFLQGYVTADLDELRPEAALPTAYCNLKGRVLASGWALGEPTCVRLLIHASVAEHCAASLAKYLLFAKSKLRREGAGVSFSASALRMRSNCRRRDGLRPVMRVLAGTLDSRTLACRPVS